MYICKESQIWPDVTDDAFFDGAIQILQPRKGYRAGIDAVLLAASLDIKEHEKAQVLDAGAGVGVAGLSVAARCPQAFVTLLEKQQVLTEIAQHNIARNRFEDRVHVKMADLLTPAAMSRLKQPYFDHVISNPPFYDADAIRASDNTLKAQSNAMPRGDLKDWIKFMAMATKPGGSATVIHLAERLGELLQFFAPYFGGIQIQILYPRKHETANRILIRGIRGSRAPMQIGPGRILHTKDHTFDPQIERVLRKPVAWPIWQATKSGT